MGIQALSAASGKNVAALLLAAAVATPAFAQRVEQNATTQSSDAFGRSVGNERSGLYSPDEVRGFNPSEAGNIRMEGLYFEFAGNLSQRLVEGSTVRVGMAAQRYPFPAPSGLIDYRLVVPQDKREISLDIDSAGTIARGPGGFLDVKLPIDGERLGIAVGVGSRAATRPEGGTHSFITWSALAAFRPAPGMEFLAFGSKTTNARIEARTTLFPIGTAPPPQIERGRFLGFDWTATNTTNKTNGAIARIALSDHWRVHAGVFYSTREQEGTYADLVTAIEPDGRGNRTVIADDGNGEKIWSGEFRVIREWQAGALAHTLTASVRGRAKDRKFGGAVPLRLGSGFIQSPESWPARPAFTLGPKSSDEVRQLAGGVSYSLLWQGKASLDIGLSKATYTKSIDFADPALADPVTRDKPLLWNVSASVSLTDKIIAYAGLSRGQEDALIAPDIAVNRSEAPPAIRTKQVEAGLRFQLTRDLSLVTGVFEIARPYYNLDTAQRYRELGQLTNRGLEFSLTGKLAPGLSIVGGILLTDPKIAGEAVTNRQIGPRPVGQVRRRIVANLDWRSRGGKGPLSFDLSAEAYSSRMGNAANTLVAPARANFNLGARYRFNLAGASMILRPQLQNVFNAYGWQVSSSGGFNYTPDRLVSVQLTADW